MSKRDGKVTWGKIAASMPPNLAGVGFGRRPFRCRLTSKWRGPSLAKSKQGSKKSLPFMVNVQGGDIIVRLGDFRAVYYKPAGTPQLILRERTRCDDYELIAGAWQAANARARMLGWIV
jgi:hypothetical protein